MIISYKRVLGEAIAKSGMTLHKIGRRVGSGKGYISGIRSGHVKPPAARMTKKLAKFFGLNVDQLLALALLEKRPRGLSLQAIRTTVDEILDAEAKAAQAAIELERADQQKEAS